MLQEIVCLQKKLQFKVVFERTNDTTVLYQGAFTIHWASQNISVIRLPSSISEQYYLLLLLVVLLVLFLLLTAIELSLGGSSPYTSTDKKDKNKYT